MTSPRVTLFSSSENDQHRYEFDITDYLIAQIQRDRLFAQISTFARLGKPKQDGLQTIFNHLARQGDEQAVTLFQHSNETDTPLYHDIHLHQVAAFLAQYAPDCLPLLAAMVPPPSA